MIWMLHIHTALPSAIVALSREGVLVDFLSNDEQREHTSFLHIAIDKLLRKAHLKPKDLKTVGVVTGPGSYSGIRVGLSAAKGLCYALNIPLVTFNSLEALTQSFYQCYPTESGVICPMIDARRMEVFTAVYDRDLTPLLQPNSLELQASTIDYFSPFNMAAVFGSGSEKFSTIFQNNDKLFERQVDITPESLVSLTTQKYNTRDFEDVSNANALYLKPVYFASKKT